MSEDRSRSGKGYGPFGFWPWPFWQHMLMAAAVALTMEVLR